MYSQASDERCDNFNYTFHNPIKPKEYQLASTNADLPGSMMEYFFNLPQIYLRVQLSEPHLASVAVVQ